MTKKPEANSAELQIVPFLISHADSRPDAKVVQAVSNAINALNQQSGVVFGPLTLKCVTGAFWNIWNSQRGDTPITFFQSNPAAGGSNGVGAFLPLGDYATPGVSYDSGSVPSSPGTQILFAPTSDATVVAHPAGFNWILDDAGSDNSRNLNYYTMIPPPGYMALGVACTGGGSPNPEAYWCVRSDLVRGVAARGIWSDSGQRWRHHNGNISGPVVNLTVAELSMLFAPQTFLSAEGGNPAYALLLQQADLPVSAFDPDAPKYDPTITSGDVTSYGLHSAKIVPYTAIADPGYLNQSSASPFYFIVAEPYWQCTTMIPTPDGGSFSVTQTVGTTQSDSQTFSQSTSMTVSADVGVAYEGVSASVSTSYTKSFGTSVSHSSSHATQVQTQISINLPKQPRTWIWERQTQISVFRTDTTQITPVVYSEPDIIFVPSQQP